MGHVEMAMKFQSILAALRPLEEGGNGHSKEPFPMGPSQPLPTTDTCTWALTLNAGVSLRLAAFILWPLTP